MVLMGRCRSEADECEWITHRNVTANMSKSSRTYVRTGRHVYMMLGIGGILHLRPMGCSKAQEKCEERGSR